MKKLVLLLLLLNLAACEHWHGTGPVSLDMKPPPGPPEYTQGWKDGCETGVAANTNSFYKLFTKIKQDPKMVQSPVYRKVWTDAYNYCWFATSSSLQGHI